MSVGTKIREIQTFLFSNIEDYLNWHYYNYDKQNGIKEISLNVNDDGEVSVEYIELF